MQIDARKGPGGVQRMVCRTTPATGCRDGTDPTLGLSGRLRMGVWDVASQPPLLPCLFDTYLGLLF